MPTEIVGTMAVSGGQKQTALLMPGAYPAERVTGGVKVTKLWENPDPTQSFGSQDINLSSSDYDMLLFIAGYQNTNLHNLSEIVLKGYGSKMNYSSDTGYSYTVTRSRLITRTDDTTYHVNGAYTQSANGSRSTDNTFIIPMAVYGIKLC